MATGYKQTFVRLRSRSTGEWRVDPRLRALLAEDARAAGSNLNDVAAQLLGRAYGVPVEPAGRRGNPGDSEPQLNLSLPIRLWQAIAARATRHDPPRSVQVEILHALCAHYDLAAPNGRAVAAA